MTKEPTEKNLHKIANIVRTARELIISVNWSRRKFILGAFAQHSQSYGLKLPKKLIHDLMGRIVPISSKKNRADVSLITRCRDIITGIYYDCILYYEIKSSVAGMSGIHNIDHIRPFQEDLDYFILFLIDDYDDYKERCYVLPKKFLTENPEFRLNNMQGTKEVNKENKFVEKALSLKKNLAYEKFDKGNLLPGTEYSDLLNYLEYMADAVHMMNNNKISHRIGTSPYRRENVNPIVKTTVNVTDGPRGAYNPARKFGIEVDGLTIHGNTNKERVYNFVKHLGPSLAANFLTNSWLSTKPSAWRTIKIKGYYLNSRLSYRDIDTCFRSGSKRRPDLNIRLFTID